MKKTKNVQIIAFVLATIMISTMVIPAVEVNAADNSNVISKEENIYANLGSDGSVQDIYVVNSYQLTSDGKIVDYGDYSETRNLSSESTICRTNEEVTVGATKGQFYYQGNLKSKDLPWLIHIQYILNGKDYSAEDLAGKSGALIIKLETKQNTSVNSTFFENYLLQATITLNTNQCNNIDTDGATIANVSDTKQLVYNIMAGQEKTITIHADVTDFEMGPISIKAVPMSFDLNTENLNLGELTDNTNKIREATTTLNEGTAELASGGDSLQSGVKQYADGIENLYDGSLKVLDGINALDGGLSAYTSGVTRIAAGTNELADKTSELPELMSQLSTAIEKIDKGSSTLASEESWSKIETGFIQIDNGLINMKAGIQKMDKEAVIPMIDALSEDGNLSTGAQNIEKGLGGIESYVSCLSDISTEYNQQVSKLQTILADLDQTAGIAELSDSGEEIQTMEEITTEEPQITTSTDTVEGDYQEDYTDTSTETTIDEDGNTVITITNNIYQTKTDTVTVTTDTITNQKETITNNINNYIRTQNNTTDIVSDLSSVCQGMTINSAALSGVLNGDETLGNPGVIAAVSGCTTGFAELKNGLYAGQNSLLNTLRILHTTMTGEGGLIEGVDRLIGGISELEDALYRNTGKSVKSGVNQLSSNLSLLNDKTPTLMQNSNQLISGIDALQNGANILAEQNLKIQDGGDILVSGGKSLVSGANTLTSKSEELTSGTSELVTGLHTLQNGIQEFADKTENLDEQIEESIDKKISEISGEDYQVISFVSEKNTKVQAVQFIMKTNGIEKSKQITNESEKKTLSFWDKLKKLF